jgi:hypothetical protein
MPLPIPNLLQGEMFFDYTASVLWVGTKANGNQQIPLSTLNGVVFPDSTIQTSAAAASIFKQVSVTLTSAQLLALSTTPITLVPAPGAGFYIFPTYFTMQYHFGGTAYTSPAVGNDCYFLYGNPPEVNPTNLIMLYDWAATASGIIKATASCTFIGICGEGLTPYTTVNNAPVIFTAPNALGAGNGTLTITLNYSILPLP